MAIDSVRTVHRKTCTRNAYFGESASKLGWYVCAVSRRVADKVTGRWLTMVRLSGEWSGRGDEVTQDKGALAI